jgi:hypothetical protein
VPVWFVSVVEDTSFDFDSLETEALSLLCSSFIFSKQEEVYRETDRQ